MNAELLVPGLSTTTEASLLAAVVSLNAAPRPPGDARVVGQDGRSWPLLNWVHWTVPDGQAGVSLAQATIDHLSPHTRQRVELQIGNRLAATATITTLPDRLPTAGERPFIIMLGSCFCEAEDKEGRLGRAFAALADGSRPDLKILCGDQVYLDSPFYRFLLPHTRNSLAEMFLSNYASTWGQSGDAQGFQLMLSTGANVFASDDHEFWNNAPFPSFSANTWTAEGRTDWWTLAKSLYSAFQTPGGEAVREFAVGELSFFVADTRINRSDDRTTFITPADMARLETWVSGLTFPGILVVGQPVFEHQTNWTGNVADWNLPDFAQYEDLCRALTNAPQPIIVLTGDVHYGRLARARLNSRADLVEIVSSPMSLVTGGGKRAWHEAPDRFPAMPMRDVIQVPIETMTTWERAVDHFLTLELWQEGGRLKIRVRTFETRPAPSSPASPVFEDFVQRSA